jgi:hypothetical protein
VADQLSRPFGVQNKMIKQKGKRLFKENSVDWEIVKTHSLSMGEKDPDSAQEQLFQRILEIHKRIELGHLGISATYSISREDIPLQWAETVSQRGGDHVSLLSIQ